ncbi:ammonium transporter [Massilia glaciei]|uniref:Ammonium transporter n=1 Tax=Massilia glaciei TaxID=1524097 RepID=A0A2U2HFN8_9BURK|nr:ammonium transporter [Massilia glaciei]
MRLTTVIFGLIIGLAALNATGQDATVPPQPATAMDAGSAGAGAETPVPAAPAATPAPKAAAAAPLTRPTLVAASAINSGDTAWMLTATALVVLMTLPGLALFYGGMARKKNLLATMAHSFAAACVVTILWVVIGYSLAFAPGDTFIGGYGRVMLDGMLYIKETGMLTVHHIAPTVPESVFMMFQLSFAIITPALITGAFAERMKFSAFLMFIALWSVLVYAPVAHCVWDPSGWLAAQGVLDFAGGTVVHINAGVAGLVAAIMIGPRKGFGKEAMPPHNLVLTVIGASLLWVGWFGFNAGSAVAADGRAGMAMLVTQLASAVGAMAWMLAEWIRRGKPSVLGMVSGAVAGLVAITPASGFVDVRGAFAIGAAAGFACYWGATALKARFSYDDTLDVFGVHAIGGIVGALLTGVFAVKAIGGVEGSVAVQAIGVLATVAYSAFMTALILLLISLLIGLNISTRENQAFALMARLHVILRRETGRVTDIEYMRVDPDYFRHVLGLALEAASDDAHQLAEKLELAYLGADGLFALRPKAPLAARPAASALPLAPGLAAAVIAPPPAQAYVRGLR